MVELLLFESEEVARFGPAVELLRATVRGRVYENAVARLEHGPGGLVCELKPPRGGLFLWLGPLVAEVGGRKEALRALWEAFSAAEAGGSLLVVYDETREYRRRPGAPPRGEARLRAPACLVLEAARERRLLFFAGREFLDFRLPPGRPVLAPLRE